MCIEKYFAGGMSRRNSPAGHNLECSDYEGVAMPGILMPIGDATEALDTFYSYYFLPDDGYEGEPSRP